MPVDDLDRCRVVHIVSKVFQILITVTIVGHDFPNIGCHRDTFQVVPECMVEYHFSNCNANN